MRGSSNYCFGYDMRLKRGIRVSMNGRPHFVGIVLKSQKRDGDLRSTVLWANGTSGDYPSYQLVDFDKFFEHAEKEFMQLDRARSILASLEVKAKQQQKVLDRVPIRIVYTPGYEPITEAIWGDEKLFSGKTISPTELKQKADELGVPIEDGGKITYDPGRTKKRPARATQRQSSLSAKAPVTQRTRVLAF